jgi:hypothetical protein
MLQFEDLASRCRCLLPWRRNAGFDEPEPGRVTLGLVARHFMRPIWAEARDIRVLCPFQRPCLRSFALSSPSPQACGWPPTGWANQVPSVASYRPFPPSAWARRCLAVEFRHPIYGAFGAPISLAYYKYDMYNTYIRSNTRPTEKRSLNALWFSSPFFGFRHGAVWLRADPSVDIRNRHDLDRAYQLPNPVLEIGTAPVPCMN